jgi:hypothetical protein
MQLFTAADKALSTSTATTAPPIAQSMASARMIFCWLTRILARHLPPDDARTFAWFVLAGCEPDHTHGKFRSLRPQARLALGLPVPDAI